MYRVLYENIGKNRVEGIIKYNIRFPECVEKDEDFCKAFMESLDEEIKSLIIKTGLKYE